jgi:uncharacterized protein YjbJ (UPF0337 family)
MSTSDSTIKGKFDEVVGNVKQAVGEAVGNDSLANKGTAQQVKGHAEQAWGSVKEATSDTAEKKQPEAESKAHDIREKIASTAANVKEHIQSGIADLTHKKSE